MASLSFKINEVSSGTSLKKNDRSSNRIVVILHQRFELSVDHIHTIKSLYICISDNKTPSITARSLFNPLLSYVNSYRQKALS